MGSVIKKGSGEPRVAIHPVKHQCFRASRGTREQLTAHSALQCSPRPGEMVLYLPFFQLCCIHQYNIYRYIKLYIMYITCMTCNT